MAEEDPEPTTGSLPEVSRTRWNAALALNVVCFFPPLLGAGFFVAGRPRWGFTYLGLSVVLLGVPYLAVGLGVWIGGLGEDLNLAPFFVAAVFAVLATVALWITGIVRLREWRREALVQQDEP